MGCIGAVCQLNAQTGPVTDVAGAWVGVDRDIVTVVGADARSYLHGQVSQDIQSLAVGESRWTLVLAPNGRVDVLARVLCVADDRFELDTEAGYGDVLAARLDRFRIRVKAELERSTANLHVNIGEPTPPKTVAPAHQSRIGWWNEGRWLTEPPAGASGGRYVRRLRARSDRCRLAGDGHRDRPRRADPRGDRRRPRGSRLHERLLPRSGTRRADGLPWFAGAPTAANRRCRRRRQAR